jgi:hypothetical protein
MCAPLTPARSKAAARDGCSPQVTLAFAPQPARGEHRTLGVSTPSPTGDLSHGAEAVRQAEAGT